MVRFVGVVLCACLLLGVIVHGNTEDGSESCTTVCHHVHQYDPLLVQACKCTVHGNHKGHTTLGPAHTDDVCKYLCSIQMGGAACDCSIAIVPGRK